MPEPYAREGVLEEQFADLLKGLVLDAEIVAWVTEALRQSHTDAKPRHDIAITRIQAEHNRLQSRIDAMYLDKLDGRIDAPFFDPEDLRVAPRAGPVALLDRRTPSCKSNLLGRRDSTPRTCPAGAQPVPKAGTS